MESEINAKLAEQVTAERLSEAPDYLLRELDDIPDDCTEGYGVWVDDEKIATVYLAPDPGGEGKDLWFGYDETAEDPVETEEEIGESIEEAAEYLANAIASKGSVNETVTREGELYYHPACIFLMHGDDRYDKKISFGSAEEMDAAEVIAVGEVYPWGADDGNPEVERPDWIKAHYEQHGLEYPKVYFQKVTFEIENPALYQ